MVHHVWQQDSRGLVTTQTVHDLTDLAIDSNALALFNRELAVLFKN